jgi:hypothetical protein
LLCVLLEGKKFEMLKRKGQICFSDQKVNPFMYWNKLTFPNSVSEISFQLSRVAMKKFSRSRNKIFSVPGTVSTGNLSIARVISRIFPFYVFIISFL